MSYAAKLIVVAGLASGLAAPGWAQEAPTVTDPVNCAQFVAMDEAAMTQAIEDARAAEGTADVNGAPTTAEETVESPTATTDGVASSQSATTTDTAEAPKTEAPAATTDGVASSEPAVAPATDAEKDAQTPEEMMALAMTACADQPDLALVDAIKPMP